MEPQYERFVSPEKNTSLDGLRDRRVVSSQLFKVDEFFLRSVVYSDKSSIASFRPPYLCCSCFPWPSLRARGRCRASGGGGSSKCSGETWCRRSSLAGSRRRKLPGGITPSRRGAFRAGTRRTGAAAAGLWSPFALGTTPWCAGRTAPCMRAGFCRPRAPASSTRPPPCARRPVARAGKCLCRSGKSTSRPGNGTANHCRSGMPTGLSGHGYPCPSGTRTSARTAWIGDPPRQGGSRLDDREQGDKDASRGGGDEDARRGRGTSVESMYVKFKMNQCM